MINIAFSFDYNFYRQAIIAITSLLDFAKNKINYNIYCLIKSDIKSQEQEEIFDIIKQKSPESRVFFISMDKYFNNVFETKRITSSAYSRLKLHFLLGNLNRIIYSDVDVIFNTDLSELSQIDLTNYFFAGVKEIFLNTEESIKYHNNIFPDRKYYLKKIAKNYRNSGFLILNLDKLRQGNFDKQIDKLSLNNYPYQDQDVLNIIFQNKMNKVYTLSPSYIVMPQGIPRGYQLAVIENIISFKDYYDVINTPKIIHWANNKPWDNPYIPQGYIWWIYVYKNKSYFDYFYDNAKIKPDINLIRSLCK